MSGFFEKGFGELSAGDEVTTGGRTITETDVVAFAMLAGDMHPLHVDREWAARSPFGERVAQGHMLLAYTFGLVSVGADRVLALRRLREVTFPRPVRIGDTIRARCRVRTTKPLRDDVGLVGLVWDVVNQSDELAVRAAVELLWRR